MAYEGNHYRAARPIVAALLVSVPFAGTALGQAQKSAGSSATNSVLSEPATCSAALNQLFVFMSYTREMEFNICACTKKKLSSLSSTKANDVLIECAGPHAVKYFRNYAHQRVGLPASAGRLTTSQSDYYFTCWGEELWSKTLRHAENERRATMGDIDEIEITCLSRIKKPSSPR